MENEEFSKLKYTVSNHFEVETLFTAESFSHFDRWSLSVGTGYQEDVLSTLKISEENYFECSPITLVS